ncbi:hypothetical protein BC829DRAFT_434346, partial [Chytridium lagenaria]
MPFEAAHNAAMRFIKGIPYHRKEATEARPSPTEPLTDNGSKKLPASITSVSHCGLFSSLVVDVSSRQLNHFKIKAKDVDADFIMPFLQQSEQAFATSTSEQRVGSMAVDMVIGGTVRSCGSDKEQYLSEIVATEFRDLNMEPASGNMDSILSLQTKGDAEVGIEQLQELRWKIQIALSKQKKFNVYGLHKIARKRKRLKRFAGDSRLRKSLHITLNLLFETGKMLEDHIVYLGTLSGEERARLERWAKFYDLVNKYPRPTKEHAAVEMQDVAADMRANEAKAIMEAAALHTSNPMKTPSFNEYGLLRHYNYCSHTATMPDSANLRI